MSALHRGVQARPAHRAAAPLAGLETAGDADLLALVLGGGAASATRRARALLDASGGLLGLARGALCEGADAARLGDAARARVEAALELGKRASGAAALAPGQVLSDPATVAAWARTAWGAETHEELWIVAVDAHHAVMGIRRIAVGTPNECRFAVRDVLRVVLRLGAPAFFLVHNHPSGDPSPSDDDVEATRRVVEAARTTGLVLLDHVVVAPRRYRSMFELGLLDGAAATPR